MMKAVVLAGGVRSGLEIPGSGLPRALWPFPNKPLISLVLRFLERSGCEQIAICANGKTRMIAAELSGGAEPWKNLNYSEDRLPRGPAGCLRDLQDWLMAEGDEPFVAIQATGFYDFDLAAMAKEHRETGAAVTVGARQCPDGEDLLEPAGVYIVEPSALALVPSVGYQDFKEQFLPKLLARGLRVHCHTLRGRNSGSGAVLIHSTGHYLSAMREAILRSVPPMAEKGLPQGYQLMRDEQGNPIVVNIAAQIDPQARISGPAWIDAGASVGARAVLAGTTVLGPGVKVGAGALLHRTVALRQAVIAENAEIFSTVVPPHAVCSGQQNRRGRAGRRVMGESEPAHGILRHFMRVFSL